jgi:uncharacterized protein
VIKHHRIRHDIYPLLPDVRTRLAEEDEVLFAYLFGSDGRGNPGPLSDVDIAVFAHPERAEDLWRLRLRLIGVVTETLRTDEVDLVILNEANVSLCYQVLESKRILFSRDEARRMAFEARTVQLYLDAEPLRRRSWDALVKRIQEGRYGR